MSFSRDFLKSIGLTAEQIGAVMEEHTAVTTALKTQRDEEKTNAEKYKADAEKLQEVQKQLDEAKARKDYKPDYDRLSKEYEDYKAKIAHEAEAEKVRAAWKQLLKECSISDNWVEDIAAVTVYDGMKVNDSGRLEDEDAHRKTIEEKYSRYKATPGQKGADVPTPPATDKSGGNPELAELAARFHDERYGKRSDSE